MVFSLSTTAVFAGDCTDKVLDNTQKGKDIDNLSKNRLNTYKNLRNSYNKAAAAYFNNKECNPGLKDPKDPPVVLSNIAFSGIFDLYKKDTGTSTDLTDLNNYKYTGVKWNSRSSSQSAKCKQLAQTALSLQNNLNKAKAKVEITLGIRRGDKTAFSCQCDENGENAQCVQYLEEVQTKKVENAIKGCKPFNVYLSELSSCPLCHIFKIILNTDAKLASIGWSALAKNLQKVMISFLLAYLAFNTIKIIFSPAGANAGAYLRTVLGLGLKVSIAYFLLADAGMIYGNFVSPVIKGGLDTGMALLSIGNPTVESCLNNAVDIPTIESGELDSSLLNSIYKVTDCFSKSAATMPAVGRGLICYGWQNPSNWANRILSIMNDAGKALGFGGTDIRVPNLSMWLTGLIVYIFGIAIWMVIGFYLIDCTVQIGFICVLIPIFIACWPFKVTSKYTTKGVETLMNIFFTFAMTGVMLVIGIEIINYSAGGADEKGIEAFMVALGTNDEDTLKQMTDLSGVELLILVACCIFAFKLIGTINNVAGQFANGVGLNIGAQMGGTAASAMTAVGKGAAKMGGKALSTAGGFVADKTGLTGLTNKAGDAVKGAALGAAAKAGAKIGLKKYQPQGEKGMPAKPIKNSKNGEAPNTQNNQNNQDTLNNPNSQNNQNNQDTLNNQNNQNNQSENTPTRNSHDSNAPAAPAGNPQSGNAPAAPANNPQSGNAPTAPAGNPQSGNAPTAPAGNPQNGNAPTAPAGNPQSGNAPAAPAGNPQSGNAPAAPAGNPQSGNAPAAPANNPQSGNAPAAPAGNPQSGNAPAAPAGNPQSENAPAAPDVTTPNDQSENTSSENASDNSDENTSNDQNEKTPDEKDEKSSRSADINNNDNNSETDDDTPDKGNKPNEDENINISGGDVSEITDTLNESANEASGGVSASNAPASTKNIGNSTQPHINKGPDIRK